MNWIEEIFTNRAAEKINTGFEILKKFINSIIKMISDLAKIDPSQVLKYAPIIGILAAIILVIKFKK